ncbi:NuA3 HAT complex component NTO1 [Metschnikowia aff. pulcherrima]|uniref:NuA3 HAT complex component NTO1 n=1 Tax=Metschnikowia aff. pulcherrima TaxID=2163413 RepID=A0A4P6XSY4_9ASCO|nr:NuA3 HAT complex component NTO1 [Metschnikowia aff. pulcherrima]
MHAAPTNARSLEDTRSRSRGHFPDLSVHTRPQQHIFATPHVAVCKIYSERLMDSRPREEREYSEFYEKLDESTPLAFFVTKSVDPGPPLAVQSESTVSFGSTPKQYAFNAALQDYKGASQIAKPGKITKTLSAYGYRLVTKTTTKPSQCYARFQQLLPSHPLLRYDMDEQDALYLDWLNRHHENCSVTPEVFEIIMSMLESEWHKLELLMIALVGPGQDGRDVLKMDANFEKYGSDDGTGGVDSLSEQRCAVCNDLECDNTNSIVYCDGCNIAVHQECYGVAFIPEGLWFCRRCMVNRGSAVSCAFCPSKTGAFKQLDNGMWSHVVCALWIREVYFANPVYLEPIEGVASIPRSRWTLVCYICKQKTGACIQCAVRKCTQAYHVTCAKRAGLYMAMEKGVQGAVASNDTLKSYCDRHTPGHMDKETALEGIYKTRMFFRDSHSLSRKNDRLASERRQANRVNRFKWKTENGTPIAPQLFVEKVATIMNSLKVGNEGLARMLRGLTDASNAKEINKEADFKKIGSAICRYWCLKREAKKGAPLIRIRALDYEFVTPEPPTRPNTNAAEISSKESVPDKNEADDVPQMTDKVLFGHDLNKDLEKLIQVNSLAVERQKLTVSQAAETFKMIDTAYFAFATNANEILRKMSKILSGNKEHARIFKSGGLTIESIMSEVVNGSICSTLLLNEKIQRLFVERNYISTPGTASKALRYWDQSGLQELMAVEKRTSERIPFTEIDGLEFSLKPHDPSTVLLSEDLSEVEDDPFTQSNNREILRKFMS